MIYSSRRVYDSLNSAELERCEPLTFLVKHVKRGQRGNLALQFGLDGGSALVQAACELCSLVAADLRDNLGIANDSDLVGREFNLYNRDILLVKNRGRKLRCGLFFDKDSPRLTRIDGIETYTEF